MSSKLLGRKRPHQRHISSPPPVSTINASTTNSSSRLPTLKYTNQYALGLEVNTTVSSLTAFELKKEITAKQLQNEQLCAVAVCKNLVYVATKSCKIMIWEQRNNQQQQQHHKHRTSSLEDDRERLQSHMRLKKTIDYKKAQYIREMAVCLERNVLIAVFSNGHYAGLDAKNCVEYSDKKNCIVPLNKTKNAERIVTAFDKPHYRFALASKKNIYIFEYDKETRAYRVRRELNVGEVIMSCLFFNHFLCFSAHKRGMFMHEIETGKESKIDVPCMPNVTPMIHKVSHGDDDEYKQQSLHNEGYLLVQVSPTLYIFIDKTGKPAQKDTVNWSSTPVFVIDCAQYMIGYLDSKSIEVVSLVDQKAVQKLDLYAKLTTSTTARQQHAQLAHPHRQSAVVHSNSHTNSEERPNEIRGLVAMKYGGDTHSSPDHVLLYDDYEVLSLCPTPIHRQIQECVKHLRIEKGLKLLMQSAPKMSEKRAFHSDAGFALLCSLQWKRSMEHFEISDVDPRDIIYLFPDIKFEGLSYEIQHLAAPKQCTIHDIMQEVLTFKRTKLMSTATVSFDDERQNEYLTGLFFLAQFLWKRRTEPSSPDLQLKGSELKLCVDTALLKIYVRLIDQKYRDAAPFDIHDLLSESDENNCVESECERVLLESQLYFTLALFYRSKHRLSKALTTLHSIGDTGQFTGNAADAVTLSVSMLRALPATNEHLWTFAKWVLLKSPAQGMQIFTDERRRNDNDSADAEDADDDPLNTNDERFIAFETVLKYLDEDIIADIADYDSVAHFDYREVYLEFVVNACRTTGAVYHDNLAYLYLQKISRLTQLSQTGATRSEREAYAASLDGTKDKLLRLLQKSDLISFAKLLNHAKLLNLYDEVIELNKKLRNHNAVLYTLVIDKREFDAAIGYCMEAPPSSKDRSDRFLGLLRLYFAHSTDDDDDEKTAEKNGTNSTHQQQQQHEQQELHRPQHRKRQTLNLELLQQELLEGDGNEFAFMHSNRDDDDDDGSASEEVRTRGRDSGDDDDDDDDNDDGGDAFNVVSEDHEMFQFSRTRTYDVVAGRQGNGAMSLYPKQESGVGGAIGIDKQLMFDKGCELLYEYAFDMDCIGALKLLPATLDVMHLQRYIVKLIPYILHKRRMTQIAKNLHKTRYMRQNAQLAAIKSQYVTMDEFTKCSKCEKPIGASVFELDPRTFKKYHYSCFYRKPQNETAIQSSNPFDLSGTTSTMDKNDENSSNTLPPLHGQPQSNNPFQYDTSNPFD